MISGEELVRTGKSFVLDALESALGLSTVRAGGPGAASSVSVRGANSEHTLFLLDGVELNDPINPSRSYDVSHLPLSQVERVEILRGPQGLLYGSDALGGVVNIITRAGRGRPRLTLASSADTLRSLDADVSLAGTGRKTEYSFALFHERTAGLSAASAAYPGNVEKDGYRNLSLSARYAYAPRPGASLTLTVRAVDARTELDNFGGPGGDDPNSVQDYGSVLVRGQYRSLARGGRWEQAVSVSWLGAKRSNDNPADEGHPDEWDEGLYKSGLFKLDWQNNFFLKPTNTLTAGLELEQEKGRSDYLSESVYGPYESRFPTARAGVAGIYILDHWETGGRFFVTTGVRADLHSRAGGAVTFRVAPAYLIAATGTRLKATLGTGFKSPSLYQLFAPATSFGPVGNPLLRPERALGWDAGSRAGPGRGPRARRPDLVRELVPRPRRFRLRGRLRQHRPGPDAGPRGRRPRRGPRTRSASAPPTRGSRPSTPDAGTELLRRPRDKFSADAGFRLFGRVDLAGHALWVGRRLDRDFSAYPYPAVEMPPYLLLDAALTATLGPQIEVFFRVDNILDTRYETVWGYGAPGRSARLGFRLTL